MPSVVASGMRNSPSACSPLMSSGPASPIGTCATPMKFSQLPLVDVRVEGMMDEVLQLEAGALFHQSPAAVHDFRRIVVGFTAGNPLAAPAFLCHGIFDLQLQGPEGPGFEGDFDLVPGSGQSRQVRHDDDRGTEGKGKGMRLADLRRQSGPALLQHRFGRVRGGPSSHRWPGCGVPPTLRRSAGSSTRTGRRDRYS